MKIVYENDYLYGEYRSIYYDKKYDVAKIVTIEKAKAALFVSLGATVALSQIAEFFLDSICDMYEAAKVDIQLNTLEVMLENFINEFDIDKIKTIKKPTLGKAIKKLYTQGIIDTHLYESSLFIAKNRNDFIHNYFINKPKSLASIIEMKILIDQMFYTVFSLNQFINKIYTDFKEKVSDKNDIISNYIDKFGEIFIGELKV